MHLSQPTAHNRNMQPAQSTVVSDNDLLDDKQVSTEILDGKVSASTVRSWRGQARARSLPYIRVGRFCLYRRGDVVAWLAQNTVVPKRTP